MRLFLDANVVFSAAYHSQGRAQALVGLAKGRFCDLLTSSHALEEARRNLALKSPGFEERLAGVLDIVETIGEAPHALVSWAASLGLPAGDAPVLAAAVHCRAALLVTGDARDFGQLYGRVLQGVKVVTPAQALGAVLAAIS